MSGFASEWLALREPLDTRARDGALETALAGMVDTGAPLRVVDLGCGTGANLRHLAPRLGGRQQWLLVDDDPALLAEARTGTARWATGLGLAVDVEGPALVARGHDLEVRLDPLHANLATDLARVPLDGVGLITASALLDLVSPAWLDDLLRRCRGSGAAMLFALSYDGRARWSPAERGDAAMLERVNRHQRGDKGFGPALGPGAPAAACSRLEAAGLRTRSAPSDWHASPDEQAFQRMLLAGWVEAALEIDPHQRAAISAWSGRRTAHLEAGRSAVTVGHVDVLAWLPGRQGPRRL